MFGENADVWLIYGLSSLVFTALWCYLVRPKQALLRYCVQVPVVVVLFVPVRAPVALVEGASESVSMAPLPGALVVEFLSGGITALYQHLIPLLVMLIISIGLIIGLMFFDKARKVAEIKPEFEQELESVQNLAE